MNQRNQIAIIRDGNGRWGMKKKKSRNFGHLKGVDTVKKIVSYAIKLKIPIVTFYVFSSENWRRPKKEISFLFKLIKRYFTDEIERVISQGIKINIIGDIKKLSSDIKKTLNETIELTKKNKSITVNLAINYGSKNEILNAINNTKKKTTLKNFEKKLYTNNMPDPDILIRTGGYSRLSDFIIYPSTFTELFFTSKLWPDLTKNDLSNILGSSESQATYDLPDVQVCLGIT